MADIASDIGVLRHISCIVTDLEFNGKLLLDRVLSIFECH
jgi:hypothetical protein